MHIVLVDPQPLFRMGLRVLLQTVPDYHITERGCARETLAEAPLLPALFVIEAKLPDGDGIELVNQLRELHPGHRFLILSAVLDADHAGRASKAGISGYALKLDPPASTLQAICTVGRGGRWLSPNMAALCEARGLVSLSPREREIFDLVVNGLSGREVAKKLTISYKTVESHRYKINRKLGIHSVAEMVRFAAMNGVLQ